MKQPSQKQAHSINGAAIEIGAGRDKVYQAIRDGFLVARKFGRRTLILDEDLRTFLQSLPRLDLSVDQGRPTQARPVKITRQGGAA
jgi:excisionase family DNA binding protein